MFSFCKLCLLTSNEQNIWKTISLNWPVAWRVIMKLQRTITLNHARLECPIIDCNLQASPWNLPLTFWRRTGIKLEVCVPRAATSHSSVMLNFNSPDFYFPYLIAINSATKITKITEDKDQSTTGIIGSETVSWQVILVSLDKHEQSPFVSISLHFCTHKFHEVELP